MKSSLKGDVKYINVFSLYAKNTSFNNAAVLSN